jgi:protein phosphatase
MEQLVAASYGATDIGMLRAVNQDSFLADDARQLYVVADGMGGHAGGEIASMICIETIQDFVEKCEQFSNVGNVQHPSMEIRSLLAGAVNHASARIYERALEEPMLRGMGTTATLLKILESFAYVAHVGDSRLSLLRAGFIYQMTADHSLVSEQIRAGLLTEEEAAFHQLRNVITRSVGYQEEEEVDTSAFPVQKDDLLLICSDGLYSKVSDQEIAAILKEYGLKAAPKLIALANDRGGDDNISVVLIEIKDSALPSRTT